MDGYRLREALHDGSPVFGTLLVSESPLWPRALAGVGLDFVFIDTEHTALTRSQVAWMCQTYAGMDLAPLVRVLSPDPNLAANVLDTGAAGVIVPYVESADEVRALVGAVRMRPLKGRRQQEALAGREPLQGELSAYLAHRNEGHSLIVNIESTPAIDQLDEILAVDGLDGVLIGPHDLSCSLGIPEQYGHPEFLAAVSGVFHRARERGVGAGIHFMGEVGEQIRWLQAGANMLIHSGDITLFAKHLRADLDAIRGATGGESSSGDTSPIVI